MKLAKKLALFMAVVMIVSMLPTALSGSLAAGFKVLNVTSNKVTVYAGSVYQIKTNGSNVTYKSNKKSVAKVSDSGLVTAKKKGTATIRVTNASTGKAVKLKIRVKKPVGYTVSKKSGSYTRTIKVKIKAKKGYTVYYTVNGKFKLSKKIKSRKSKTITVKKNTTLNLYIKKNSDKVTAKQMKKAKGKAVNCPEYQYIINSSAASLSGVAQSSTSSPDTDIDIVDSTELDNPVVPSADEADSSGANTADWAQDDAQGADTDELWFAIDSVKYVALSDDGVTVTDENGEESTDSGVSMKSGVVKITVPGVYVLSGTLTDASVQVKSGEGEYTLILNGVDISCSSTAALYATKKATKLTVTLANETQNSLKGPEEYTFEDGEDEPDAAMFVKKELVINGRGSLSVTDPNGDAIKCKDALKVAQASITVNAGDDGITGKDSFAASNTALNITSIGDGIKTNIQTDESLGYVDISDSSVTINSSGDGIQADTTAKFENSDIIITTNYTDANDSFKGIKAGGELTLDDGSAVLAGFVYIASGTFKINSVEDAIQSKKDMLIAGGKITVDSYNDGIQAKYNLTISGDETVIDVTTHKNSAYTFIDSYKGIKAGISSDDGTVESDGTLLITGGTITVDTTAAGITNDSGSEKGDDAIHCNNIMRIDGGTMTLAAGDDALHSDSELVINGGTITVTACYEGIESYEIYLEGGEVNVTSRDDGVNAAGGNDSSGSTGETNPWRPGGTNPSMSSESSGTLYINGGTYYINASGDGLDSNGSIYMTGGNVYVYGPTSGGNGIFDYGDSDSVFKKSGGLLIGTGTSDMAVYPTCTNGAMCRYTVNGTAGKQCSITDSSGTYTFTPPKSYSLVIVSAPGMTANSSYTLTYNGSSSSTAKAVQSVSGNSGANSRR